MIDLGWMPDAQAQAWGTLVETDPAELRTLLAGVREAGSLARTRGDEAALDSLEAVAMMVRVDIAVR